METSIIITLIICSTIIFLVIFNKIFPGNELQEKDRIFGINNYLSCISPLLKGQYQEKVYIRYVESYNKILIAAPADIAEAITEFHKKINDNKYALYSNECHMEFVRILNLIRKRYRSKIDISRYELPQLYQK